MDKIIAFFMAIIAFFSSLFGLTPKQKYDLFLENEAYGSHSRQVVDIAFPENVKDEAGLVLMIHGGGWTEGGKGVYTDSIKYAASLGYVGAAMNYRYVSDNITIHDIMDDITYALNLIKEKGQERGVNINKVLLTGMSAGAHLSLLYAYSMKAEAPIAPVAVVSLCGPTDLADIDVLSDFLTDNPLGDSSSILNLLSKCSGYPLTPDNIASDEAQKSLRGISPLFFVDKQTVPTVICHGKLDNVVPFANADLLDKALTANGVKHDFVIYPNSAHGLEDDPDCAQLASDLLLQYAATYLK